MQCRKLVNVRVNFPVSENAILEKLNCGTRIIRTRHAIRAFRMAIAYSWRTGSRGSVKDQKVIFGNKKNDITTKIECVSIVLGPWLNIELRWPKFWVVPRLFFIPKRQKQRREHKLSNFFRIQNFISILSVFLRWGLWLFTFSLCMRIGKVFA